MNLICSYIFAVVSIGVSVLLFLIPIGVLGIINERINEKIHGFAYAILMVLEISMALSIIFFSLYHMENIIFPLNMFSGCIGLGMLLATIVMTEGIKRKNSVNY